MAVIGIETATPVLGVGLIENNRMVADYRLNKNLSHAEKLPELIERIVKDTGNKSESISLIAVSIGPGSFTGLRIGLGVAKGLAWGWQVPLIDVPTPDALVCQAPGIKQHAAVLLNARKGEVYQTLYTWNNDSWIPDAETRCILEKDLGNDLPDENLIIMGNGCNPFGDYLHKIRPGAVILSDQYVFPSGAAVAQVGLKLFEEGKRSNINEIVPLYFKTFQGIL